VQLGFPGFAAPLLSAPPVVDAVRVPASPAPVTAPLEQLRQLDAALASAGPPAGDAAFRYDARTPGMHSAAGTTIVRPRAATGTLHGAGILWVHWLGDPATTNHTEFAADARALAERGATSVLVDAMWAQPNWFETGRSPATDACDVPRQVIALRRREPADVEEQEALLDVYRHALGM